MSRLSTVIILKTDRYTDTRGRTYMYTTTRHAPVVTI